jgi:tetratricopeptide (TPR) repeat protein
MRKVQWASGVAIFLVGAAAGIASSKVKVEPGLFTSKAPAAASADLLQAAETIAGNDTWEEIAVGRVEYLSGKKADGQSIFDRVLASPKVKAGDYIRVARVYLEAKQWDKAQPLLDKVVELEPKDEDWLAEVGAWYNLHGNRARAEELFARSLAQENSSVYNTAKMAGSYVGVAPL